MQARITTARVVFLWLACGGGGLAVAGEDISRAIRGQSMDQVLMRTDVAVLPFTVRDELLLANVAEYAKLSPSQAFAVLRNYEGLHSSKVGLKPLSPFMWFEGCRGCSQFYDRGKQYLKIEFDPLTLAVSVGEFDKYVEAWVFASLDRQASVRVNVLARDVTLASTAPVVAPCEREPLDSVAKAVRHGAGWKAGLIRVVGGMATKSLSVEQEGDFRGTYSGRSDSGSFEGSYRGQSTITVPDEEARARARAWATELIQRAEARSSGVRRTALLDTTLTPGQSVDGFVYFKKNKVQKASVLQVVIGTISFEFPLRW